MDLHRQGLIRKISQADYIQMTPDGNFLRRKLHEFFRIMVTKLTFNDAALHDNDYELYIDEIDRLHNKLSANLEKLHKADPKMLYSKNNKLLKEPTRRLFGGLMILVCTPTSLSYNHLGCGEVQCVTIAESSSVIL